MSRWVAVPLVLCVLWARVCIADEDAGSDQSPSRPTIKFNRWQEEWSALADPKVPREPFDDLKYIPLSSQDPKTYLSLGANLRERFEANDAAGFGVGSNKQADYVISRLEVHSDLRIGRQQIGFDLQRFVSVRDGPNVRQSYDAAWLDYEVDRWRFISFYSHPVQDRDLRPFDDYSNDRLNYGGFRMERQLMSAAQVSVYFSRFTQDGVRFPSVSGNESRDIVDVHFSGKHAAIDWDVEGMTQSGQLGGEPIHAWAFGSLLGYTFMEIPWRPRAGLQFDAASGDKSPTDHELNTFNPLFPNGYYVTLAG